jgi:hypothetical protein
MRHNRSSLLVKPPCTPIDEGCHHGKDYRGWHILLEELPCCHERANIVDPFYNEMEIAMDRSRLVLGTQQRGLMNVDRIK